MNCTHCGDELSPARAEIYQHCMKQECVDAYIIERRSHMAIDLISKSGFRIVYKD